MFKAWRQRRANAQASVKRRDRWLLRLGGVLLVGFGVFVRVSDPYPVAAARLIYFDYLQRLAPRSFDPELPVRVVDIDEASLATYGQWPWPRTLVAELVDRLNGYGAASVGFDMLFAEPDRFSPARLAEDPVYSALMEGAGDLSLLDNDVRLADSNAALPVILGVALRPEGGENTIQSKAGIIEIGERPGAGLNRVLAWTPLAPPLDETAMGIGSVNVAPRDAYGVVRTVPLLWNGPSGVMPSFSIEALRVAMQEPNIFLEGSQDEEGIIQFIELGGISIPTTETGEIWVRFRHDDPALYISATDVLSQSDEDWLHNEINGRIILVGTSAAGLLDIRETPLGRSVPGVSIHAQVIEQVLLGQTLQRSDFIRGLEIVSFVSLGLVVVTVMSIGGAVMSFFAGGAAGAAVLAASWIGFQNGSVLFDASFPLLGGMINFGVLAGYLFIVAEREKRAIRRSFAHYVAPEILDEMDRTGQELSLGGKTQELTVFFSDIRNFTPLAESMQSDDLVQLLNGLFTELSHEIQAEKGTVDKFIGDAIMAFWNAPLAIENHQLHAARAALRLRSSLERFNETPIMQGRPPIALAIGCASGQACVGNIGSEDRFNYTAIGDVVNVAARIESVCRRVAFDIVVSEAVKEAIGDELALLEAGAVELKGKSLPERIFIVVGGKEIAASSAFGELQALHNRLCNELRERAAVTDLPDRIADLGDISIKVNPQLPEFYAALLVRQEDFRIEAPESAAVTGEAAPGLGSIDAS